MPFSKYAASFDRFGIQAVDFVDANQPVILFALFRAARLAFDHVAAPQLEAADLRLADVDVVVADVVAGAAQEAVSLGKDVEDAAGHLDAGARDLRLHEQRDDLVFLDFRRRWDLDFEFFGDLDQLVLRLLAELSRGLNRRHFDLRKLIVIDGRMLREVMPAARSPAASAAPLLGAHIVVGAVLVGWDDVPFAEEYLSLEPLAPSLSDRGRGEAAFAIRSVT